MRIRTIDQAYEEIRKADPETAITRNYIRTLVTDGTIPHIMAGAKYLVDLDVLEDYIRGRTRMCM